MRPKTIIILMAVLALLVALAIVVYNNSRPPGMEEEVNTPYFPDFDEKNIASVLLEKPRDKKEVDRVELKISETGWVVANRWNYPTNAEGIPKLMAALKDLRRGQVRILQADQHDKYEVSAEKALHLKVDCLSGETKADLYFGKRERGKKFFAREMGKDPIRVMDFGDFKADPTEWMKKECFDTEVLKIDNVSEIRLKRPDGVLRLIKTEVEEPDPKNASQTVKKTVWEAIEPEKFRAKEGAARSLASAILRLTLEDIASLEVKPEYGLDNAALALEVVVNGYGNISISFGAQQKDKKSYYTKVSGIKEIILVSEGGFQNFNKKLDDFREPEKEEPKKPEDLKKEDPGKKTEAPKEETKESGKTEPGKPGPEKEKTGTGETGSADKPAQAQPDTSGKGQGISPEPEKTAEPEKPGEPEEPEEPEKDSAEPANPGPPSPPEKPK
ncbi:MAG: DUF4340 domain-containing protein [Planctomycetota bacterium]|jgi:hypothetical protein